jgi:hypothetical protein
MKSLVGIVVLKIKFFYQRFHKLQFNSYAKAKKRANSTKGFTVAILLKKHSSECLQIFPDLHRFV